MGISNWGFVWGFYIGILNVDFKWDFECGY